MRAEQLQRDYYERTAASYDEAHFDQDQEHAVALDFIAAWARSWGQGISILDVGSGTGRAVAHFLSTVPGAHVQGVEPVEALRVKAIEKGIPPDVIVDGRGESLPFGDQSFDVVCSFAVLHHAPRPDAVVADMLRVARRAVFVSDANRFGQGRFASRLLKLTLYGCGLFWPVEYVRTRGSMHHESAGDGIFYSYSVYDSLPRLNRWADRVAMVPLVEAVPTPPLVARVLGPLITSPAVLACAFRDR